MTVTRNCICSRGRRDETQRTELQSEPVGGWRLGLASGSYVIAVECGIFVKPLVRFIWRPCADAFPSAPYPGRIIQDGRATCVLHLGRGVIQVTHFV